MMITPKELKVKIKNNYTRLQICQEAGISLEDFDAEMHRMYHSKTCAELLRELKSNEKKAKRLSKTSSEPYESESESEAEAEAEMKESVAEPEVEDMHSETETEIKDECHETHQPSRSLDEVLEEIDKRTADLSTLERRHRESEKVRNCIKSKLLARKQQLMRLQEQVNQISNEIPELLDEFRAEEQRMQEYNLQIASVKTSLGELETLRENLNTIPVLIYKDGRIEIDNEEVQAPENWKEVFREFYSYDCLDSLKWSDQKVLAKLIAIVNTLPGDRKKEFVFELEEMEEAFEIMKGGFIS